MTIEIRNVSKRFGTAVALQSVDLDVPEGSLTALLGPSGGGKVHAVARDRRPGGAR